MDALKEDRDKYKVGYDALPGVQKELDDLKKAAEQDGENPYKAQYEDLKQEFDNYKADVAAKELTAKKTAAYSDLLKNAGISEKRIGAILKVSRLDNIELDDKGAIKDADGVSARAKEEWKDFIVTEGTQGADTHTPPEGNGGDHTPSRAAMVAKKHYEAIYGKGDSE